jgi:hypothetical protein
VTKPTGKNAKSVLSCVSVYAPSSISGAKVIIGISAAFEYVAHLFSGVEISKIQEFGIAFGTSSVDGNVKSAGALWLPLPKTGQMYETVRLIGEGHDGWAGVCADQAKLQCMGSK